MTGTRKYKKQSNINNKTKKAHPHAASIIQLRPNFPLYASKPYAGDKMLVYQMTEEKRTHDKCFIDNVSWFGNKEVAKHYKKSNNSIYLWKTIKPMKLIRISQGNDGVFRNLFMRHQGKLTPRIQLTTAQTNKIKRIAPESLDLSYLDLSLNEKALYEFNFVFGYLTVHEQYNFLKLLQLLMEHHFLQMKARGTIQISHKIALKIKYYQLNYLLTKKEKYNRLSLYELDKYAVSNACKLLPGIDGIYQKNGTSFWFPDLIVYKMNIQEYILFRPHRILKYIKQIE